MLHPHETLSQEVGTTFMFENQSVKVWHLELDAGQATDWHKHELDYLYIVTDPGKVRTEYLDGTFEEIEDKRGDTVMRKRDDGHRLVNIGQTRYTNVVVELKR